MRNKKIIYGGNKIRADVYLLLCKAARKYVDVETELRKLRKMGCNLETVEQLKKQYEAGDISLVQHIEGNVKLCIEKVTKEDLIETLLKEYKIKRERVWDVEPCTAIGLEHSGISHIEERIVEKRR